MLRGLRARLRVEPVRLAAAVRSTHPAARARRRLSGGGRRADPALDRRLHAKVQWTLTVFVVGVWTGCSFSVRQRVVLPLQTLSNLLAALRESDFSIRARGASGDDPLGAVMLEVNVLASTLHDQRWARSRPVRCSDRDGGDRRRRLHLRRCEDAASRQSRR
jgi:hypothetical protein